MLVCLISYLYVPAQRPDNDIDEKHTYSITVWYFKDAIKLHLLKLRKRDLSWDEYKVPKGTIARTCT